MKKMKIIILMKIIKITNDSSNNEIENKEKENILKQNENQDK